jgi:hypothetical protein
MSHVIKDGQPAAMPSEVVVALLHCFARETHHKNAGTSSAEFSYLSA